MWSQKLIMKQLIFIHFFLNLYILAILQPVLPIVEYLVNYNYMKNELCENKEKPILKCHGKCYLEKQVKKLDEPNKGHNIPIPPKIDLDKLIVIIYDQFLFNYSIILPWQKKIYFDNEIEDRISSSSLFRPPISLL